MRRRRTLVLLTVALTAGCIQIHHPDYRPTVWRTVVENVSYPVTFVQEALPPAPPAAAPPRQRVAMGPSRPSARAPVVAETPDASSAERPLEPARCYADAAPPAVSSREPTVTTTRMGIPAPASAPDCPLELVETTGLASLRYAQVGIVQVMQAPLGTDPLDPGLRDLVRARACALGGSSVSILSSGDVDVPSAQSSYAVYGVFRDKSFEELLSLL